MYAGVPMTAPVTVGAGALPGSIRLASPKSVTNGSSWRSTRMFDGLRSRWRMARWWAYDTARATFTIRRAAPRGSSLSRSMCRERLPPSTSFMLKYGWSSAWPTS